LEKFILGIIFVLVVIPTLDVLTSFIVSFVEMIKSWFAIVIAKNNQKIQDLSAPDIPQRAIGFAIEEEVDEDDL
jgi:hypothetical protein